MYLRVTSLLEVSVKQYFFKLKAHAELVFGLITIQMAALLISLSGSFSMSSGNAYLTVGAKYYSADTSIVLTLFWVFFVAVTLTAPHNKKIDFTFVSNRVSSNLSNVGLLLTACVFGGLTATLLGVPLREILYFTTDRTQILASGFYIALGDLLLSAVAAIFYMVLIAASGYFLGVLMRINVIFVLIVAAIIFGLAWIKPESIQAVYDFFAAETSLMVFAAKIILAAVVLFGMSTLISDRMEVRGQ